MKQEKVKKNASKFARRETLKSQVERDVSSRQMYAFASEFFKKGG